MMDLQTALVGAAIVIISAAVLLFIALFGIKEKSYEEALAEQRQQTNLLLGLQNRSKPKEKKPKKTGKKVKEKQPSMTSNKSEPEEEAESDKQAALTETSDSSPSAEVIRHHVEFKEEPATIEEPPVKETIIKKRLKRDKVRPILVNRDMSEETVVLDEMCETPSANHFEQLHPKDEFELLHAQIKEEQAAVKQEKINKTKPNTETLHPEPKNNNNKKAAKQQTSGEVVVPPPIITTDVVAEPKNNGKKVIAKQQANELALAAPVPEKEEIVAVIPQQTNGLIAATGKDKKKKKNEFNSIHQLGDKQGVNLAVLNTLVRKAELSRSEIQILIDVLLNKQHEAPAVLDEWSEGKADPVQKLKKQLAEKEKLLAEEQEALASAQAKLKEVRAEQVAERSQLQQRTRALEETLQAKQLECQSANNHIHSLNQKFQQLQVQMNEEIMKHHKLMEEHAGLQMQRQQLEHHLAQTQEAQGTVAQLQNDLQDLQAHNNQLTKELITMNEQKEHQQGTIVQFQHQLGHFTKDLEQKNEIIRQMEDAHADLEHRLSMCHKQENDFTLETSQLKSNCQQQLEEIRRLEHSNNQSLNEIRLFQEQEDGFEKIIFQLKSEITQLQDEKVQLETALKTSSLEESKSHKIEVMNLHNEISSVKTQLQQTEKKHVAELEATAKKFHAEIEELKHKNNELRKRNWKVMEALKAAESNSSNSSQTGPNLDVAIAKAQQEEQQIYKNLIQRLFPSIKINDGILQEQWIPEVEKAIQNHLTSLQNTLQSTEETDNSEVAKLQAQILNYKSVIDDTEGMLNKLQAHVEQEETNWRKEISAKEAEIEALKQQQIKQKVEPSTPEIQGVQFAYECIEKSLPAIIDELQVQLAALETQLRVEQEAKQRLTEECHLYKTRSKQPPVDTISQVEKLFEEVNRLAEELRAERTKNVELQAQIDTSAKTQNHNSSNGPSITIENNGN